MQETAFTWAANWSNFAPSELLKGQSGQALIEMLKNRCNLLECMAVSRSLHLYPLPYYAANARIPYDLFCGEGFTKSHTIEVIYEEMDDIF